MVGDWATLPQKWPPPPRMWPVRVNGRNRSEGYESHLLQTSGDTLLLTFGVVPRNVPIIIIRNIPCSVLRSAVTTAGKMNVYFDMPPRHPPGQGFGFQCLEPFRLGERPTYRRLTT